MKKLILIFSLLTLSIVPGFADSPLTSTDFYRAYLDVPIVKKAADNPNKLTKEMMEYLYDDTNPLDIRIALINAVGWNIDGLTTFNDYFDYCMNAREKEAFLELTNGDSSYVYEEQHFDPFEESIVVEIDENGEAQEYSEGTYLNSLLQSVPMDQLAVLTYLKAMSDYFDTEGNYSLMEFCVQFGNMRKQSYMLPMGLVLAQTALDMGDWGNIYPAMNFYLFSPDIQDVRPEAIDIIMEYINGYKEYADRP